MLNTPVTNHQDFTQAGIVRSYGDDRLLDTEAKEFDDALYDFAQVSKAEKRLASSCRKGLATRPRSERSSSSSIPSRA